MFYVIRYYEKIKIKWELRNEQYLTLQAAIIAIKHIEDTPTRAFVSMKKVG